MLQHTAVKSKHVDRYSISECIVLLNPSAASGTSVNTNNTELKQTP